MLMDGNDDSRNSWYENLQDGKLDKPSELSEPNTDDGGDDGSEGSNDRNDSAKKSGRLAEKLAMANKVGSNPFGWSMRDAVNDAREAEKNGSNSGFKNNVKGRSLEDTVAKTMPGGKMLAKQAKKMGPFGTILLVIVALVGIVAGTQSLAPFGIVANGLERFNFLRTSMNKRTTYFQRFMFSSDRNKPITKNAGIFGTEKFTFGVGMKSRLSKQGITVMSEGGAKFMVYKDGDTIFAITANDADIGKIPNSVDIDGKRVEITRKTNLDTALKESGGFLDALDRGTRTLKGHIAGWFDDTSEMLHKKVLKNSRNKFKDATGGESEEDIAKLARSEGMDEGMGNTDAVVGDDDHNEKSGLTEISEETKTGRDGKPIIVENTTDVPISDDGVAASKGKTRTSKAVMNQQTKEAINSKVNKMSRATGAANLVCAVTKILSSINQIMAGIHIATILNHAMAFLEVEDKAKAGDSKGELSTYMNKMYEKGDTVVYNADGQEEIVKSGTSSMEAAPILELFSDGKYKTGSDEASRKIADEFSLDSVSILSKKTMQGGGFLSAVMNSGISSKIIGDAEKAAKDFQRGATFYGTCLFTQAGAAAANTIADLVLVFTTAGVGNIVKELAKNAVKAVKAVAISTIASLALAAVIPHIAKWLMTDFLEDALGEYGGYAVALGMQSYMGKNQQKSSGLPATKDTIMAFYQVHQEVVAAEAEYERKQHSPFDVTNKYTFLGSIINSLVPMAATMGSPITTISKTMTTVGSSIGSILPTASAEGEVEFKGSLKYDCSGLSNIGAVGNAACDAYYITDVSTIDEDPIDVFNAVAKSDPNNFYDATEDDPNPKINPDSKLGKWAMACAARDSQFGLVDSNVINAVQLINTGNTTLDAVVSGGVSLVPFVGDAVDIYNAAKEGSVLDWATGENCVKEEYKYYSRYSEDQRLMESAGVIKQSAVTALLNDYYDKNPIDDSYEGTIARYSGMTKDEVTEVLAAIDYVQFIAEYEPKGYGPELPIEEPSNYIFESNEVVAYNSPIILNKSSEFADIRNRTLIV